jgi:hypothetical protein
VIQSMPSGLKCRKKSKNLSELGIKNLVILLPIFGDIKKKDLITSFLDYQSIIEFKNRI